MAFEIRCVESMPFAENSYILWRPGNSQAIVIDPGFEPDKILQELKSNNLTAVMLLNTHGHVDHIAGNAAMKEAFPGAPIVIGQSDAVMLSDPMANLSGAWGFNITSPPPDVLLPDDSAVEIAGFMLEAMEIPGHSPGHVVYVLREPDRVHVLGGDVLFNGSIGRTDFPGGSMEQLVSGIRRRLWPLPPDTIVYPGHGPTTTIGEEKRANPFCAGE
ncbi:MAG: MBL fold metallo-hydrolase [Gemmataceae bacterium]